MSRPFSIHETAEAEVNEAADFYDLREPGLGNVFLDEVERTIEAICQHAEAAPLLRGSARKKPLLKFPYSLVYSVWSNEIRLLAVAHQKRRPFYWRERRQFLTELFLRQRDEDFFVEWLARVLGSRQFVGLPV